MKPSIAAPDASAAESSEAGPSRLTYVRVILLFTVLGLALRLTRLGAQSIWADEGMTIAWIAEIEARGWRSLLDNIHGPLHTACVFLTSRVSMQEAWLRLPSVLAGTLAIPAFAELGRRLWGARVGATAAALLALSPFALYYSQEVRNYSFTLLFAPLALAAAWSLAQRPGWRAGVALAAFELGAILSNLNGVFLVLGLNLWLVVALARQRRAWAAWLLPHVVLLALLAPYGARAYRQVRPERLVGAETALDEPAPLRGQTTLHPMSLPYTAYAFAAGYSLGATLEELRGAPAAAAERRHWPALAAVALGFGVPLLAGLVGRGAWPTSAPLVFVIVTVAGFTVWLAASNIKPFNVRYVSVLLPAYLVLAARGLWTLPRAWRLACATLMLLVSVWSCANYLFVARYGRDDARGALHYVMTHARPDELVVHINLGYPLLYYDVLPQRVKHAEPSSGRSLEAARDYVGRIRETETSLWFLESRSEQLDPNGYLRQACEERAVRSVTQVFVGIRVHHFDFATAPRDWGP